MIYSPYYFNIGTYLPPYQILTSPEQTQVIEPTHLPVSSPQEVHVQVLPTLTYLRYQLLVLESLKQYLPLVHGLYSDLDPLLLR